MTLDRVKDFNEKNPIGSEVTVRQANGVQFVTKTRGPAEDRDGIPTIVVADSDEIIHLDNILVNAKFPAHDDGTPSVPPDAPENPTGTSELSTPGSTTEDGSDDPLDPGPVPGEEGEPSA